MKLWLKSKVIGWVCTGYEWNSKIRYPDLEAPVGWRDHVRWWIESWLDHAFGKAYIGSREEIRDGIDAALDDVNPKYLTPNQREIRARLSEWVDAQEAQ